MMRKIFFIIVSFYLLSIFSVNKILAACSSTCNLANDGNTKCMSGAMYTCDGGKKNWDHWYDCPYGCADGCSCASKPAATATTKPAATATTKPANTPTSNLPQPTEVPCTTCGTPSQVCTYVCQTCSGSLTNGYKNISCWASQTCKTEGADPCYTRDNVGAPATQCPNTCVGVTPIPSSAPVEPSCQVWTCWDMGTPQCSVGFPGCSGGVGYCDNCGTDCGTCSGAPPGGSTPVPTLPACSENCFDPIISPCTTTTCYNKNCLGNCNQWCRGTKTNDCACAANTCVGDTCIGTCGDVCPGTKVDDSLTYCGAISRQYSETPQTTGTVWSRVEGCSSSVDEVFFPTWNTYGGQDDIVWYPGTKNGGNWEKYIDISQHQPTLGNTIAVHVYDDGFCRPVGASRELVGATTILITPKTCSVGVSNATATQGKGVSIMTTGNAHINPGSDIVRSWVSATGNSVIPGGVTYDYGGNTGINAVLYGNNFYELVNTNLTSTNSNTTSSSFVVHAPPGTYRIHCDVPTDLDGNSVKCSGNPNCTFNVAGAPSTCTGWKSCSNNDFATFTILPPPSLSAFTIRRGSDWGYMPKDTTNRSHTCDLYLADSTPPRRVVYVAHVYNPAGYENIDTVQIRWMGDPTSTMNMTFNSGSVNNAVYVVAVNLGADKNRNLAYGFEINMTNDDGDSSGWVLIKTDPNTLGTVNSDPALNIERQLKIWDCQVPVMGTLYDYSRQSVICTDNWSSILPRLSADVGFNALKFTNTSSPYPSVVMSVPDTSTYSSIAGNGLVWGKNYISVFNNGEFNGVAPENTMGDLLASGIGLKIADLGRSPNVLFCPIGETFNIGDNVDPYSSNPNARIAYKFIEDQEAWYQVEGAGVKSGGGLQYGVPVTAPGAIKFLTLGNSTVYNGLVSATSINNINGNNDKNDLGGPGLPEPYKNWYLEQNTNDGDIYNYNYFYNNFYVKAGLGETRTSWGGWVADQIYFVNGDLNIDVDSPAVNPNTQTMMIIVSGNITIQPGVTNLDGIYIADRSITVIGDNSAPLTINGMLYAGGSVGLYRSFSDKTANNTAPAVKVNYSPGLIFNLPPEIMRVLSGWKEE